jgi:hypothetical protein
LYPQARFTILEIVALKASSFAEVIRCRMKDKISFLALLRPLAKLVRGANSVSVAQKIHLSINLRALFWGVHPKFVAKISPTQSTPFYL